MDWLALIDSIGGGLPAAVIVGLSVVCWKQNIRINELTDARLSDAKEHGKEVREVADGSKDAMNGLTRVLEVRING